MGPRLLVGVGRATELDEPRRRLLELLEGVVPLGVEVQVALFSDGPVRRDLEALADVRVLVPPPPRTAGGLVQAAARRISATLADRVHDARTRDDLAWLHPPDGVLVHGPEAAPVLRYVRTPGVPVTTYAHPWDFSVAGLSPLDRDRLVARTDRYVAVDDAVAADLVAAGADPARIAAEHHPYAIPDPPPSWDERARLRADLGVPLDTTVVAVPPVADWVDAPDLTLAVAWEVERLAERAHPGSPWPGTVWWYGMPDAGEGEARWAVDFDVDRMGLGNVRLSHADPAWAEVVVVADLVVLPLRSTAVLPDGFAEVAARAACPVLCWQGHPGTPEVDRCGGTVVPSGDVTAMAGSVHAAVTDAATHRQAREATWARAVAHLEPLVPMGVPLPPDDGGPTS
jgi:hypothetical protein